MSEWVTGSSPVNFDQLLGHTVLIEVFQVNCPGCFLHALPKAIDLYHKYSKDGLSVLGMATAFEDFDKNTLENLKLLATQNQVIGETQKYLAENNLLVDGKLSYQIPFPLAMDSITKQQKEFTDDEIQSFICQHISNFSDKNEEQKRSIKQQALNHLHNRSYSPETFNLYALQGTPSHIIIDKKGVLRAVEFGHFTDMEWFISSLMQE